ncbi:MAG: aminodeoxychorismate synthase component I [Acidimicrobiia bacterium]|nr:aminodeoxychorismate synthase component I [Acidimicrobiia bacterium]
MNRPRPSLEGVTARFDDYRGGVPPLRLDDPYRIWQAQQIEEVRTVVDQAEAESRAGAWVAGYIAYEAAPAFDQRLVVREAKSELPLVWFAAFRSAAAHPAGGGEYYRLDSLRPEIGQEEYSRRIETIRDLIRVGDTYQTNFTFRLRGRYEGDLRSLYADLGAAQRGGYHALLTGGRHTVVSASPELFFSWDGRRIESRPMKGTVPRGRWEQEDSRYRQRLLTSAKDRAENVMIVDLLRNDLGRVARFGSVGVERLFEVERYETVWQMTSTVAAQTRPEVGLFDILAAMFPCGSVTGAPKVRTMEIIRDLEVSPRGVYCGAIGLLAPPGSGRPRAEFSVAIRTLVADQVGGEVEYGVGGGVVYESTPNREYQEAMVKARFLSRRHRPLALLETMKWEPDQGIWLRERHLNRLRSSARFLGIPVREVEIAAILDGLEGAIPLRVRLLVGKDGNPSLETTPLGSNRAEPVRLAIDNCPLDRSDYLRYHKTTRREPYEEAAARHPGADDVVLVNDRGEAVETTIANLAVRCSDRWVTPPIGSGCLPGTYREELLDTGLLVEGELLVADLVEAEEVAVFNSVQGWRPARLL